MSSGILKQFPGEAMLPRYNYHVTDTIVSMEDGRLAFIVKTKGLPFEVISDNRLENQYDFLNDLFLNIAKTTAGRLAIWLHHDHYKTEFVENYPYRYEWQKAFTTKYMQKFSGKDIFENDFYITFILKPHENDEQDDAIRELEEIQQTIMTSLESYEVETLGAYTHEGNMFSTFYEFIGYLYNGFHERIPITSTALYQAVQTSTLHHAHKMQETRFPDGGRVFSTYFDLKDFPEPTTRGKTNPLLSLPFPFVFCLSFSCIQATESIRLINQTINKMVSAGDEAHEQIQEMESGKGAIQSGQVVFGELHGALRAFGATEKLAEFNGTTARIALSGQCATIFVPATLSAPETFSSMFPGNVKRRPRVMPKTTRNLLGLFSMNTYSSGKQWGNPLGDGASVIPLQTAVSGVYHFNFHYSVAGLDVRGEKRAGHTVITGATGSGKTTLQTTLLTFLDARIENKLFAIDKDGSMRGFVEAVGGTYFRLSSGEPTGLNPLQLPDTPQNRHFLYDLVSACGRKAGIENTAEDTRDIKQAVDNVFEMPHAQRRFGLLVQSIPDRGENCLARRLAMWCYGEEKGRYAYALDNPTNAFNWEEFHRIGFDVSDFLVANHPATEPILSYLLHLKSLMQKDGEPLATVVEEFWLPLKYQTTANQILDILKTGRKRGEFIVLVSQSPEDVIQSPLLPTILQQTPTKIYLPNPDAEYNPPDGGGYIRFGLTHKEFQQLKKLGLQSRMFMIKQGSMSCLAKLDLHGMGDEIAVLAMDAEDFPYLDAAKRTKGNHPDSWIPEYRVLRKAGRKQHV